MLSVMHPQNHFQRRNENDFTLYPDPPTNMDMSARPVAPEACVGFQTIMPQNMLMGVNPSGLDSWASAEQGMFGHVSPSLPPASDEGDAQVPPSNLSSAASAPSVSSSAAGSPQPYPSQPPRIGEWQQIPQGGLALVGQDYYPPSTEYQAYDPSLEEFQAFDFSKPETGFDPAILHPDARMAVTGYEHSPFQPQPSIYPPPSPAMSSSPQPPSHSPYANGFPHQFHNNSFQPVVDQRRQSVVSSFSVVSHEQLSPAAEEPGKEKQRCPHADCGKVFKDLKAHMLTHQTERPEKCPITTCEYHIKGFARKYDKNRHTLTHYKGNMVCGFCPGSGTASEKSFNRADVFKRHLTAVHGVEQTPPNSRKKSCSSANGGKKLAGYAADATGKCSTCSSTFTNAQDFYEHLDDCVLRIVQREDPAEAINAQRLAEVENDQSVVVTLEKNKLPIATLPAAPSIGGEDEEDDVDMVEEDSEDSRSHRDKSPDRPKTVKTGPVNGVQKSRGLTHSRGGVPLPSKGRPRKSRRDYPKSWGFDKGQMTMKKRVMAVFDGQRRLAKDDMMLSTEHEVRIKLPDGKNYVTDLDVQTMKRAEGFHQATEEEKGPWVSDDPTEEDLQTMIRLQQQQQRQEQ